MILLPGLRTSDSLKVILPGISISKRCTFLCVASSLPSGENSREVLWYFWVEGTNSGILPPRRYARASDAKADRA